LFVCNIEACIYKRTVINEVPQSECNFLLVLIRFHACVSTVNQISKGFVLHTGKRYKANYGYMRREYKPVHSVGLRVDPKVHYRHPLQYTLNHHSQN
jgi:hypothetical protein